MSVVTVERDDPFGALPVSGEWTVDDLDKLPDDGRRYELFDGAVVMSPASVARHQRAVRAIFLLLHRACPEDLEVFFAPFDFRPTRRRSFQPDVLVARRSDVDPDDCMKKPPVLAVEVLSNSTRALDQVFKRSMYVTSGVELFWIFDPRWAEFVSYERAGDDDYTEVAWANGDERITLERPYPVEICPAEIVKG